MRLPSRKTRKRRAREGRKRCALDWLRLLLCLAWGALVIGAYAARDSLAGLVLLGAGSFIFLTSGNPRFRRRGKRRRRRRAPVPGRNERTGR